MNKPSIRIEFSSDNQTELDLWVKTPIDVPQGPVDEDSLELLIGQMRSLGSGMKHVVYVRVDEDSMYITEAFTLARLQHPTMSTRREYSARD